MNLPTAKELAQLSSSDATLYLNIQLNRLNGILLEAAEKNQFSAIFSIENNDYVLFIEEEKIYIKDFILELLEHLNYKVSNIGVDFYPIVENLDYYEISWEM